MFGLDRLIKDGAGKKRAGKESRSEGCSFGPEQEESGQSQEAAAPAATATKAPRPRKGQGDQSPKAATKRPRRPKLPRRPKPQRRPSRRRQAPWIVRITGDELILRFVRDKGNATTEQIPQALGSLQPRRQVGQQPHQPGEERQARAQQRSKRPWFALQPAGFCCCFDRADHHPTA